MQGKSSCCPHVSSVDSVTWEELRLKQQTCTTCNSCSVKSINLWLCLVGPCQYVGCGESFEDHSSQHARDRGHSLTINLTTLRIWCYRCEIEVFPTKNTPSFVIPENSASIPIKKITESQGSMSRSGTDNQSLDSSPHRSLSLDDSDTDTEDENLKPRGLSGLQNLGNTCYLNSAVQALSNCPPLTRFFLDCSSWVRPEKSPMLSKSYMKLMVEIWSKKRPSYVVPSGVVNGIKVVHPMFRGYSQQDAQEFLRCFMDEIHEELKQPISVLEEEEEDGNGGQTEVSKEAVSSPKLKRQSSTASNSSSQSEDFYETCDSGLSSDRYSSDINGDDHQNQNSDQKHTRRANTVSDGKMYTSIGKPSDRDSGAGDSISSNKNDHGSNKVFRKTGSASKGKDAGDGLQAGEDLPKGRNTASPRLHRISESTDKSQGKSQYASKASIGPKGQKKNVQHCSIISDIFDGKIMSSVQCLTCERVSTTKETFQDLSLPIPSSEHLRLIHSSSGAPKGGSCGEVHQGWFSWMFGWMKSWFSGPMITLQDCLAAFFSADELKGDNMYSCEKCKKLRNGIKFSRVLELPEILCIHLKRFRHEFYSSKISTYVSFPLDSLEMKPYLTKDCVSEVTLYDLVAVICHHGTAGGGHYTAYCLNQHNEQWYEYDDQYVTEVEVSQVINCEAYVLFYRYDQGQGNPTHVSRICLNHDEACQDMDKSKSWTRGKRNDDMVNLRQRAVQLMEAREPSLMQFYISKQWINRFNTFAEPGPINNRDFLCSHGGVMPHKVHHVEDLAVPFNQALWDFLYQRFGGGPVCNHLYPCTVCQLELDKLRHRQKTEMEQFIQLNERFHEENPSVIYAISMSWFKEWENFVRAKTDTPPGPIDNQRISMNKGGQPAVKPNSDHGQLSADMWQYLFGIYGGGPQLILKQNLSSSSMHSSSSSSHHGSAAQSAVNTQHTKSSPASDAERSGKRSSSPAQTSEQTPQASENPECEQSAQSDSSDSKQTRKNADTCTSDTKKSTESSNVSQEEITKNDSCSQNSEQPSEKVAAEVAQS